LMISGRDEPRDGQPRAGLVSSSKPLPWGRRSLVTKVNKVNKDLFQTSAAAPEPNEMHKNTHRFL
jgi:hypothetical protein